MAVVLFGFAALVVDIGNAFDVREQASAAADAGALAGERYLAGAVMPDGTVADPTLLATTVEDAVDSNYPSAKGGWATCVDSSVPAGFTPVSTSQCVEYQVVTNSAGAPVGTSVRVRIPLRKVQSTFGGIFGVGSISRFSGGGRPCRRGSAVAVSAMRSEARRWWAARSGLRRSLPDTVRKAPSGRTVDRPARDTGGWQWLSDEPGPLRHERATSPEATRATCLRAFTCSTTARSMLRRQCPN